MSFVVKTADLTKVKSLSLALLSPHLSYTQTGKRGVTAAPVAPLLMVARCDPCSVARCDTPTRLYR